MDKKTPQKAPQSPGLLQSTETTLPELWPTVDNLPVDNRVMEVINPRTPPNFGQKVKEMEQLQEQKILEDLQAFTPDALSDKIKELENRAYELGIREGHETTRGRLLNVLEEKMGTATGM